MWCPTLSAARFGGPRQRRATRRISSLEVLEDRLAPAVIPWAYEWRATPSAVAAGGGGGGGSITLTQEPFHTAAGDSKIVAANLRASSTAPPGSPDEFGPS